jgi:hypothetical protein
LCFASLVALGCSSSAGIVLVGGDAGDAGGDESSPPAPASDACRGFAGPDFSGPVQKGEGSNDIRSLKAVHCAASDSASDIKIELAQTKVESGIFVARLTQSAPHRADATVCVSATWSGHFFNFENDAESFHLRARGLYPPGGDEIGDDNVQLGGCMGIQCSADGPHLVDTWAIHCASDPNP